MSVQSWRIGRMIAGSVLSVSIAAAGPLLFASVSAAQTASAHDAAVAAAGKGDYVAAAALAKQAAAAGQPLDPDQVDFISGKAAKQQAALDEAAKTKAAQEAAAGNAQKIMDRQQKDYQSRALKAERAANDMAALCAQQGAAMSAFGSAMQGSAAQSVGHGAGTLATANDQPANPVPLSNERSPGGCS